MGVFGTKSVVSVYLDAGSLSVLNAQASGSDAKVLGFSSSAGLAGAENDVAKSQQFAEKIKKAFQEAGVHTKSVSLAVPAEGAMIRYFELPILPKKEEKNAVRFEAQKYVPLDMKDLYYDYDRYTDAAGKKVRVVLFACKKQWVDQVSAMIMLAGAKVERVELVSQAVVRAFCHGSRKKSGQVEAMIFPNDDQRSAELILFKENAVLFTRRLSYTQARDTLSVDVPFFISEIRISFDYFFENFKNEKIGKIHLVAVSSDASRQSLQEAMQKELSLPVEITQFPSMAGPGQVFSTGIAATYGLALGGLQPDNNKKIDLKPVEGPAGVTLTWEDEKKQLQDLAVKEIFGVAAALVGIYILLSGMVSSKNAELQRIFAGYPTTESAGIQEPLGNLQTKQAQLLTKIDFGNNLLEKRGYFTLKMNELAKAVPPQMRLAQLRYEDNINNEGGSDLVLHLEGYVFSSEAGSELSAINRLVKQLSENKDFMAGLEGIKIASTKRAVVKATPATRFVLDCTSLKKS